MILKSESVRLDAKIGDVRLASAKVHLLRIPLRRPFVISLGVQPDYLGTIVELGSDERTGYGEGSTIPQITGESPEGVAATAKWILNALAGRTFGGLEDFSAFVDAAIHANPTAKSAIDIAVHDLLGKTWNLHVIRMLGGRFADLPTSLTIGLVPVDESLRQLEELQAEKCQIIKVKVGGKVEDDIARVRAIAERLSTERFYVDANQGYSLRDALRLSPVLQESGALFFEQPLGRHAYEDLRTLRKSSGVAVMLDESISSPRDVIEAVRREAADYVNVKLTKSGGIHQAMKTLITAQAYGIEAMVGCMVEGKLSTAAGLCVASSVGNVKFTDLDGYTSMVAQPFEGGLTYRDGVNRPVQGVGMAVEKMDANW
ncbi:MAG TPA: dipeptide epimerase [Thermoplasmata archaeon]|nr:dipeptide epimerase [Thermoplasmata archaeon]